MTQKTKFQTLLLLLFTTVLMSWQLPKPMIKGRVLDPTSGELLEHAMVKLYTEDTVLETLTNTEGRFYFKSLEAGEYEMEVFKSGYEVAHLQKFEVFEDQPTFLMVKMTREKPQVFSIIKED
jgi:hypothetical protein